MADHVREQIGSRPVVVSVSGGKDSTATALHLTDLGVRFSCVFADTGWEAPETYAYIADVLEPRFGPITTVRCDYRGATCMESLIRVKSAFPWRRGRFCTEQLKVIPIQRHLATFDDPVNVTGIRRDESRERASAKEWVDDSAEWGTVWQPLVDWSEQDVMDVHRRHGVPLNQLYSAGASRVGCWPCINARKAEVRMLPPERVDLIRQLEVEVTAAANARHLEKHGEPLAWPRAFFQGRGPKSLIGQRNAMPIDDVMGWARTGHGGRQFEMFDELAGSACVRGLCG